MSILEKIETDFREALKGRDTLKAETLKMLKTDLMYEKARTGEDLDEEKMIEVISRAAKKRKEASNEYRKGNREDLAKNEEDELAIIETYLPEQLSEKEIEGVLDGILGEMGEVTQKDFGRVMGTAMKELKGKADGVLVKKILTAKITEKQKD